MGNKKNNGTLRSLGGGSSNPNPSNTNAVNIDPSKLETLTCPECNSIFFSEVTMYKKLPATMSPSGMPTIIPMPVIICNNCGTVHPDTAPRELYSNGKENSEG